MSSARRTRWAVPILIAGIACSLIVAVVSLSYFAGQADGDSPSLAMAYAFILGPFLLAGVPLMLIGLLAAIRPWSTRIGWLRWAASAFVALWFGLLLQGPGLFIQKPVSHGIATVDGLPGHSATWSGTVDCMWARGGVDQAVATVPAMAPGDGQDFELTVWPTEDNVDALGWVDESGQSHFVSIDSSDHSSDGARGSITTVSAVFGAGDSRSVVTMRWDCGSAPIGEGRG